VFRSRTRAVIFTQHEHARLAAELALAWRREDIPLPFNSFVRGVALHDRGFDVLDGDDIEALSLARYLAIQRSGAAPRGEDPVVDLVVALHIRRLAASRPWRAQFVGELDALLPRLYHAAGVSEEAALASDRVTEVSDRVSFDFCFEEPASDEVGGITYSIDGRGTIKLHPWTLAVPRMTGLIVGYRADGYPGDLEPVIVSYEVVAGANS
jgi:hypothetical protein